MHATSCLKDAASAAKMPETMLAKALCHYATERLFSPDEPDRETWGELLVEHAEVSQKMVAPAVDEDAAPASMGLEPTSEFTAAVGTAAPAADVPPSDSLLRDWFARGKSLLTR